MHIQYIDLFSCHKHKRCDRPFVSSLLDYYKYRIDQRVESEHPKYLAVEIDNHDKSQLRVCVSLSWPCAGITCSWLYKKLFVIMMMICYVICRVYMYNR